MATGEKFEDGAHILYVNGAYRDETPIGKLMHDFACTEPADMYYGELAERVSFFKERKEGIAIMCKVMEDMRAEAAAEAAAQAAAEAAAQATLEHGKTIVARMLAAGRYSLEEIADITEFSLDEIKEMKAEQIA